MAKSALQLVLTCSLMGPGGMEASIESLGECQFLSPLRHRHVGADKFKTERHRVLFDDSLEGVTSAMQHSESPLSFELAGPREKIYFDPSKTAFAEAVKAVSCAHIEAVGAVNGIGLVKLMGRDSGFIACFAALAAQHVDFCLIPEVPFSLEGPRSLLEMVRHRIARRKHALIVVAEGAGQELMHTNGGETDASGNRHLGDIGLFLKDKINDFFAGRRMKISLKYIDPSYTIRSVPASPQDNFYCSRLAQNAVHAGMGGRTNMLIGRWHGSFVHIPFELVVKGRRKVDPDGDLWQAVLESTGQPARMH